MMWTRSREKVRRRHWHRQGASPALLRLECLERRELPASGTTLGPLVQVSSTTPWTNLSDVSQQPNSTVYLNSEVEPRIAVDPHNSMHLVGVWQQDRWNDGAARGILAGVSTDGGQSWSISQVTGMTSNEGGITLRASDPWVSFASNGDVYASALVTNDPNVQNPYGVFVSKSTDGGHTWGTPAQVIVNTSNSFFNDKDSITADPTNSNYVYAVWDRLNFGGDPTEGAGPTLFARTTDGGQTWSTPADIYDPGANSQTLDNQIVVMPNGTLVCMFVQIDYSTNAETIKVIKSTDQGTTWSGPISVSPLQQVYETDPDTGTAIRAGDIPDIAVNRRNGDLYVVFQSGTFSNFQHDDIALSYSTDGGQTWSTPRRVNHTPTNIPTGDQQAFTPNVAVANNGTIAIGYYDLRNNTSAPGLLTDYWLVTLSPRDVQLGRAGRERRMTVASFDLEQAPYAGGYFLGDYESIVAMGTNYNSFGAFFAIANNASDPTDIFFRDPGPAAESAPALVAADFAPTLTAPAFSGVHRFENSSVAALDALLIDQAFRGTAPAHPRIEPSLIIHAADEDASRFDSWQALWPFEAFV